MPIQIPGARLLEEIIAGLPTNSRQAIQLRVLAAQISALTKENQELKAQLAALQPQHGLAAEAVKILKLFFDSGSELSPQQVAYHLNMKQGVVDHYFDILYESDFIIQSRIGVMDDPGGYSLQPKGRAFVVKHGLA